MSTKRAFDLLRVVAQYRLDTLLTPERLAIIDAPQWLRWAVKLNPMRVVPTRGVSDGDRLRAALIELGPIYIKLGQLLSTRPDLIGMTLSGELQSLQDQVPPIPSQQALATITEALGQPIESVFAELNEAPLAAASIAQVHEARLLDGTEVVAKVVRPGLRARIEEDVALFRNIAQRLNRGSSQAARLHLPEVIDDYEQTILAELDMLQEARNTTTLRRNFAESDALYVPRVYHEHCRSNLLVLERINGIPISRIDLLHAADTNLQLLAERGVATFFTQVFVDNFFHADMHPGNIFVDLSDPQDPSYIALDCAIIGSLTEQDQEYLARNLLAFFHQDYAEVARLHLHSGWVPADTDAAEFEAVIRELSEPIFEKPLSEISFGAFVVDLFQTAERFGMEIQPQLVLLQKTLLYVEGVGRTLYPQLDLWETAAPFIEGWMAERVGPLGLLRKFNSVAPEALGDLTRLPERMIDGLAELARLRSGQAQMQTQIKALSQSLTEVQGRSRNQRRLAIGLMGAAAAMLWLPLSGAGFETHPMLTTTGVLSAIAGCVMLRRA